VSSLPSLSLVVLTLDNLDLSRRCVESLRATTDVDHELIIVDNGSAPEVERWAQEAADRSILHGANLGFAAGMNAGLRAAGGETVAFVNNDTVFPPGWASTLLATFSAHPGAGIVLPAVTAAGNPVSVRSEPGTEVIVFRPFSEIPSGVVYLMSREVATALGGWNEGYHLATGEDLDLLFTVWVNDLEVVLDTRVLVDHVSQATIKRVLSDRESIRTTNLERFLTRWRTSEPPPPRLDGCPPEVYARNLDHAAAAAGWLGKLIEARAGGGSDLARRYLETNDRLAAATSTLAKLKAERTELKRQVRSLEKAAAQPGGLAGKVARRVRRALPAKPSPPPADAEPDHRPASDQRRRYETALAGGGSGPSVVFAVYTTDLDAGRGDIFVAAGLGMELERLGMSVEYRHREQWYDLPENADLVVAMLPDLDPSRLPRRVKTVAWVRNETDRWIGQRHLGLFDLVVCSSGVSEHAVRSVYPGPTGILRLGVDTTLFTPGSGSRVEVSTSVNQWGIEREVYSGLRAAPIDFPLHIYGVGKGLSTELIPFWRGPVEYFALPDIYRRSLLVLDDFNHTTERFGNVNSRVFEALACGALPVTNRRAGLQEVGLGEIPVYHDRHGLIPLITGLVDDPAGTAQLAARLEKHVEEEHSFAARAATLAEMVDGIHTGPRRTVIGVSTQPDLMRSWYPDLAAAGASLLVTTPEELSLDLARCRGFGPVAVHLAEAAPAQVDEVPTMVTAPAGSRPDMAAISIGLEEASTATTNPLATLRRTGRHALGVGDRAVVVLTADLADVEPVVEAARAARASNPAVVLVVAGEVGPESWSPLHGVVTRLAPLDDRSRLELAAAADLVVLVSGQPALFETLEAATLTGVPRVGLALAGETVAGITWVDRDDLDAVLAGAAPRPAPAILTMADRAVSVMEDRA
jgi:GT2 family glycosyltransferase